MGKLFTIGNTTMRVYSRDHRPAHAHVIAPDCEDLVRLDTLAIMCGQLPTASAGDLRWIEDNRSLIVAEWNRCNPDLATE